MKSPYNRKLVSVIAGKMLCKGPRELALLPICAIRAAVCRCFQSIFRRPKTLAYNGYLPTKHPFFAKILAGLAVLKTFGAWGVFALAAIDSLAIPIPLDALVAGYVYGSPHRAWLYCLAGAAGSALGSLLPYGVGRAGGELFLLKRIDHARMQRIRDRFEKQEFLALMVPAMLPPPTPFKLFVFSAGVFEMRLRAFLLSIFSGRIIRFAILSVLTVKFGPQIVTQVKELVK
jgi:membrane protein YqaA with SNARE-associated domain